MKAIIQQNNFPLSYGDDYPYMKYFELISYPNIEHLKQKMKGNEETKKLYLTQKMMEYDENLNSEKFKKIIENKLNNIFDFMVMNIISYSSYSYKNTKLLDIFIENKNIMKKYYKYLIKKGINYSVEEFNIEVIKQSNISNEISTKFFKDFLDKLKKKNNYLYKNIRRPILSQYALNDEYLLFDIDKIANYKSYTHLLSKYIYKDIFTDDKNKQTEYIDFDIKIDYNKYNIFDIDLEGFEDELESIILSNKKLFRSDDYNITTIYNFDGFRYKNDNLLINFIRQYKYGFEYINCQKQINQIIDINQNKNLIPIFINDFIDSFSFLFMNNCIKEINEEIKIFIDSLINRLKNNLIDKLKKNNDNLEKKIIFNFIFNIYNNLIKIISFLIDNNISLEISLDDIITNLPDIYNISFYTKYFFAVNKEYKLKHLYYIFEEFEKYLFPFILLQVKDKYKIELYDEDKENILNYFIKIKENNEETQFTIKILFEALRKFISRYLISSDLNEEKYDINNDIPLINFLDKKDLWPLGLYENNLDIIENGIKDLKEFNFLVQHSVCLYECLSGIIFEYDGNITKEKNSDIINKLQKENENEYNIYQNLSYFNDKNSDICKMIKISSLLHEFDLSNSLLFLFYNLQNNFVLPDISNDNKSFIYLSYANNGLSFNKLNLIINEANLDKIFESKNISSFNNSNINNIQNITNLVILRKYDIFCIGTNNSKLMIIKLKDNFTNIELIQEINLPDSCINNIEKFNDGQTLIIANDKHILSYELKVDDNNFNTYELKKDIKTDNNTYILKVDENNIAAFISPNTIKFYCVTNNEFIVTRVINDIKCDINSSNQKQNKLMNLVGKNNDMVAICSYGKNIYLIDLSIRQKEKIKINYERCPKDYDDWFHKHSSKDKKENILNNKNEHEEKVINNINNNDSKKIYYIDWFKNHSKDDIIIDYKSGKKYDVIISTMKECQNNFISILKCYDDYILLLDETNKVIISLIEKKDNNIVKLKYIGEFDFKDIIFFFPFGLHFMEKRNDNEKKNLDNNGAEEID